MGRGTTGIARRAGVAFAGLLWLLPGCGSDPEPAAQPTTVRSMAAVHEEPREDASGVPSLPELAPEPEPASAAAARRNAPPRLRGVQVDPAPQIPAGSDVVVVADASDPDGDEITIEYTWFVNGDEVDAEGPRFPTRQLKRDDEVRVRVVARDGRASSPPITSPVLRVVNGVPKIVSAPAGAGPDGTFSYQVVAQDPDGDRTFRYALAKAPAGMRIHPVRGLVEWTPEPHQAGTHPVEIRVEDSGGAVATQTFELIIAGPPAAPKP